MARDSYLASTDSARRAGGRENAMRTIASAAVAAPPVKIATKLPSAGAMPAAGLPRRTATSAAAVELPIVRDDETGEGSRQQVDDAGLKNGGAEAVSGCCAGYLDELGETEKGEVQAYPDEDR